MRDDSFALYSVYKKEKRTVTDTTDVQQSTNQKDVRRTRFWERDLFLWAILTNRRKMSLLFWRRGLDHLGGALCASAMLKRLAAIAERTESADISEDLREHSQHWERLAIQVLTECFSLNRDLTHKLLVRKLPRWGAGDSDATTLSESYPGCGIYAPCNVKNPQENPSVLRIAERYKLKKFVGHAACQTKLTAIWKGFMSSDTHELLILVCMFLPIFLPVIHFRNVRKRSTVASRDSAENGGSARDDPRVKLCMGRCLCDVVHFYQAPITKFFANIAANLVYLAIFSYFLIVELDEGPPTLLEYITWAWLFTMIMEEVRQIFRDQRALKYRLLGWISFDWNQFDVTLYTVFVITVVLRFALPLYSANFQWARWFYSVTLVLCFIRFTQYFYGVKSIGPKVIMIQKMVKDMFLFLAVLVVFVIGFGVAYHANMFPNSPPEWSVVVNILYYPYFQIFGELFLDTLKGEGEGACTNNETVWRQDILKRCPENTGYIVHLMLAAYLIVTNILLVNLLIAMFSYTFQRVQQKSMEVWCYYRLSLVHEYFSRPVSVPPFIVFHYIFSIIRYFCCDRNAGLCKQYHAFRRAYSDEEMRHLTLFERTAVKKVFIQNGQSIDRH
ncbi:transient receptor potential cation channel subfamily M member-like 2 [Littorina saxatilis]|uniref:transient receptor potential cation channel subfamily M member-like 2 n=1 Tax=Littorina saxatilis TaxID=31220 RepID=UPI0038B61522